MKLASVSRYLQRARRAKRNIEYKHYHNTGEKIDKVLITNQASFEKDNSMSSTDSKIPYEDTHVDNQKKMLLHLNSIADDIDDFMDENPIVEVEDSMSDLDLLVKRMEDMRSQYRSRYKEISELKYNEDLEEEFADRLKSMKDYIKFCKEAKLKIRKQEKAGKQDEMQARNNTFLFLLEDATRVLQSLEKEINIGEIPLDFGELSRRRKGLESVEENVSRLATKFTEIISFSSSSDQDKKELNMFRERYNNLLTMKTAYVNKIKTDVQRSELDKEEALKELSLDIKLHRFNGYGSPTDIFTFQSNFEKLYLHKYPKRLLPDLLKNNFLGEMALAMVRYLYDIDEIWLRLKKAFGDPKVMLEKKFEEINKVAVLYKIKDTDRLMESIQSIINLMKDLISLSKQHKIENDLYYGDAFERIVKLLGDSRVTRWIISISDKELSNQEKWKDLMEFLEKESSVLLQKKLLFKKVDNKDHKQHGNKTVHHTEPQIMSSTKSPLICSICDQDGHVATIGPNNTKVIQYYTCKKFVDMAPKQRFAAVKSKGLCYQCILPGADVTKGKHNEGKCQRDFVCKHDSHSRFKRKIHVLLCEAHKDTEENKKLLEEYKARCITREKRVEIPEFSKGIKLSFHSSGSTYRPTFDDAKIETLSRCCYSEEEISEKAIYLLQTIMVNGQCFTIFYDSGCGECVTRFNAIPRLGERAIQEYSGTIQLGGVGGQITESKHGIYSVKLPMYNHDEAKLTGVCLDEITGEFPRYPIKGTVEDDLVNAYREAGGDINELPQLPSYIGGKVDFMIGIKYLRYFPEKVFQMPSGLTIYQSKFENAGGGRGVIGGPHQVFTQIEKQFHMNTNRLSTFICNQKSLFKMGLQVNPDLKLLGFDYSFDHELKKSNHLYMSRIEKRFEDVENAGTVINYRCINCRSCKMCKDGEHTEAVSIREEVEEDLIAKSVTVDSKRRQCTARLPLLYNPSKLAPNKHKAVKVYNQQLKKLNRNPKDKADVLQSERKLQMHGYVDYVRNLPEDIQDMMRNNLIQNFIPWRAVWKEDSISTPCRVVFDASQATDSGYSLNDIIAKGRNNLNKLQEIFIRWLSHPIGFHSDIQKMYNCVSLQKEHWCMQRYIWQKDLDPSQIPEEKVIMSLIYGVKSSGNLAEHCIRRTANMAKDEYPEINEIIQKDIYVDDCLSGAMSLREAHQKADNLELVLSRGGFSLKGIAFSKMKPPTSMSDDDKSIVVAGIRWFTESDTISLNLKDLNFSKRHRGKRQKIEDDVIPIKLT